MRKDCVQDSRFAGGAIRRQDRPERGIRTGFLGRASSSAVKRPQGLICGGEVYG
jgi:hypothetical protein